MKKRRPTRVRTICHICFEKPAQQIHHKFPQTDNNRELYGELLDDPENTLPVCCDCHPKAEHYTEKEFCDILGIEPRSKSGSFKNG